MVSKWVITYLYMGYIGVTTHLLTIDPNFLGHPSRHHRFSRHTAYYRRVLILTAFAVKTAHKNQIWIRRIIAGHAGDI